MKLLSLLTLPLLLLSNKASSQLDPKPPVAGTIFRPNRSSAQNPRVRKGIGKHLASLSSTLCKRTNAGCNTRRIGITIGPDASRRPTKDASSGSKDSDLEQEKKAIPLGIDPTPRSQIQAKRPRPEPPELVITTSDHYVNDWPRSQDVFNHEVTDLPREKTDAAFQPVGMTKMVQQDKTKTKIPWKPVFNAYRAAQALASPTDLGDRSSSHPPRRLTRQDRYVDIHRVPLTEKKERLKDELEKAGWAKKDATEERRKKKIQAALDEGKYGPTRNDVDWIPPKPFEKEIPPRGAKKPAYWPSQQSDEHRFPTPYHPNEQSSGRIITNPRKPQYSGGSGSPRNDLGFLMYINGQDRYDRSYVRKDYYVGRDRRVRVAATAVYDAMSHPYHAANKLFGLKKNPALTYTEAAKNAKENRKVTNLVRQTYDENRPSNLDGKRRLANPRDEFPRAANALKDGTRVLTGKERFSMTNVSPVPDSESRAEAKLARATSRQSIEVIRQIKAVEDNPIQDTEEKHRRMANTLAKVQNIENLHNGIKTQPPIQGTGIMNGQYLKYDWGKDRSAYHNLPYEYYFTMGYTDASRPVHAQGQPRTLFNMYKGRNLSATNFIEASKAFNI